MCSQQSVWFSHIQGGPESKPCHCSNNSCLLPTNFHNMPTLYEFETRRYTGGPPNTVCVTALPCKILMTTLAMFKHVHYH